MAQRPVEITMMVLVDDEKDINIHRIVVNAAEQAGCPVIQARTVDHEYTELQRARDADQRTLHYKLREGARVVVLCGLYVWLLLTRPFRRK